MCEAALGSDESSMPEEPSYEEYSSETSAVPCDEIPGSYCTACLEEDPTQCTACAEGYTLAFTTSFICEPSEEVECPETTEPETTLPTEPVTTEPETTLDTSWYYMAAENTKCDSGET